MSAPVLDRPTVVDELTRRGFLTATGLAAAGVTTGCAAPQQVAPPARRTVSTDRGPVDVPAAPARVACADFYGAFAVVDLGLTPVGVSGDGYEDTGGNYPAALRGVAKVGDYTEPDLEAIAAQRPDLILRTIDTPDELYARLGGIAPTVVISFQQLSLTDVATRVGAVLGRAPQATALLADYRARTSAVRAAHSPLLGRMAFTFAEAAPQNSFWTMGPRWTDTGVLLDCGVRLAEPSASQTGPTQLYSLEQLGVLAASDVLLVPADPGGRAPGSEAAALLASPLWPTLPAVRAGRVHAIPYGASSLGSAFPLIGRLQEILTSIPT